MPGPTRGKLLGTARTGIQAYEGTKDYTGQDIGDVAGYKRQALAGGEAFYNPYRIDDADFRAPMEGLRSATPITTETSIPPTAPTAPAAAPTTPLGGGGGAPTPALAAKAPTEAAPGQIEDALGTAMLIAPGTLRQGIGVRNPPDLTSALAGLRRIY